MVTGGAGFIGTNALRYLKDKYPNKTIKSFDIGQPVYPVEGIEYIHGNIRSYKHLKEIVPEATKIFHFAAELGTHETFSNPHITNEVNIAGTINLLELAKEYGFKLFLASKPNVWLNPYSISKAAAEEYALMYEKEFGIKVAILKFFSVYGPYQYIHKYNKAVPYFIYRALKGKSLPVYGNGKQVADFLYVEDAVEAADTMLERNLYGEIIEYASGKGIRVNDLAIKIIKLTKSNSQIEYVPMRRGEPQEATVEANLDKAQKLLKLTPKVDLTEGLKRTISFYSKNLLETRISTTPA